MKKNFISILILIIGFANLRAQEMSQELVRSTYVLNFIKYVEWSNLENQQQFKIGVLGNKAMFDKLLNLTKNQKYEGKDYSIVYFRKEKSINKKINVLFVDNRYNDYVPDLLDICEKNSILLITDRYMNLKNVMINILPLDKGRKRYELNKANLKKANLKPTNQLLLHGGTNEDIKVIYTRKQEELEAKQKEIEKQTKILKQQKAENEKQKKEIIIQEKKIEAQKKNLSKLVSEFQKQKAVLDSNTAVLAFQKESMQKQQNAISEQETKLNEQKEKAAIQQKAIDKQTREIKKQEGRIASQRKVLRQQDALIKTQKGILVIIIAFSSLLVLLAFVVWRGYRIKKKVNKQLEEKNIAINKQKEEIEHQAEQLELANVELEKLSIVASKTENAVTIMLPNGDLEWVNAGFTRLYGYTLQLLTNEKGKNLLRISTNKDIRKIFDECVKNKETKIYESQNQTRKGDFIWVQTTLTPIVDEEGEVVKLVAIETDIRRLKDAEKEIKARNAQILKQAEELKEKNVELEKLSIVARETDNAITIMNGIGNIEWVNEGFTRLFGFTLEEYVFIKKNIISEDTPVETKLLIHQCIKEKQTVSFQSRVKTKKGSFLWVQTTLTPIVSKEGIISKLIAIGTDISKLIEAEQEIRQQHEEILQQKEILQRQNEEIQAQRDKVEQQNLHIKGSINYALTIQTAILPLKEVLDNYFENFIIYRPKDIVSGDFYWFYNKEETNELFVATVDCTGHGVPGAFMSMIGSRILSEVVAEKDSITTSELLEELNLRIKKSLKQSKTENNDGMDVALCCITDTEDKRKKVTFTGAKRPLLYFRMQDEDISILKGDRKSIGGARIKRVNIPFTNQEIILDKGDMLYLYSDGMIDQNNSKRKKYGTWRFVKLLNQIAKSDIEFQKEKIEEALDVHSESEEQRDDITIWGIKL